MIISAHQSTYNPWLGFIHKILLADIFVVMDDVQFEKNSFINRNKILQNNNEVMLSIPILTKNHTHKTLKEMKIENTRWQTKHLKSIEQSYKKSQQFNIVFEKIKKIYELRSNYIVDYTNAFLEFLLDYLKIDTKIVFASDLNIESKKLDYVVELTQKLNGDIFVFGAQGKDYADLQYLTEQKVLPYFQDYKHPFYNQMSKEFHSHMGILDLLFNEKQENIKDIILRDNISKNNLRGLYV